MTEQLHDVRLSVNGVGHDLRLPARRLLSDALRHDLGLTGTHVGCEHGVCGACTVLVDGAPMRSCLMFAVSAVECEITTVEGLTEVDGTPEGRLSPVQQAFAECHGLQCGFCTPGFLTTITAGLRANPDPSEDDAREMVAGNLCRCTGYTGIVRSVLRAAELGDSHPRQTLVEEVAEQPSRDPATDDPGDERGARAPASTSFGSGATAPGTGPTEDAS